MAANNKGGDHNDGDNNVDATGEALLDLLKKVSALSDKYIDISKEKEKLDLEHENGLSRVRVQVG